MTGVIAGSALRFANTCLSDVLRRVYMNVELKSLKKEGYVSLKIR